MEVQPAAARADGGEQPPRRVADEEEQRVGRRLLKHFQKRIRGLLVELIHAVDHGDAPRRQRRGHAHELTELPYLLDRDVAGEALPFLLRKPLQPAHVGMTAGLDELDDWMLVVGREARKITRLSRRIRKHSPSRVFGEGCLPDALGTREQPRMMKLAQCPGTRKLLDRLGLTQDHGSKSSIASRRRSVISSGEPEPSMRRTRSGSSAAIIRKARSTL